MKRSIRLGHCVCDPSQPCPCDLFKEKDLCLCAGERMASPTGPVALTKLVEKPGCASKIDQAFLKQTLKDLPVLDDPRVLVGMPAGDDAGVYEVGDGMALVQTVDVFTPSVDDPYLFGQVAAANSLSDVYAMGGRPITALSVIGFPVRKVPDRVLSEILRGGIDKMKEAGVPVIGGHSINDDQIKAGFSVTGFVETSKVAKNADASVGDVLILTKSLGTGIVAFAGQINRATQASLDAAAKSMCALNKAAANLMIKHGAHACTDVTGFSLMGHLSEMALRSGVDIELVWDDLPWLPNVLQYVADGILPGAIERNKESCGERVKPGQGVSDVMADMCFDAQTSGGLLIAIDPEKAEPLLADLHQAGVTQACVVGRVKQLGTGLVSLETTGKQTLPNPAAPGTEESAAPSQEAEVSCCGGAPSTSEAALSGVAGMAQQYQRFLASVGKPSGLDAYTKQAINVALSVATRCEPCIKGHIEKALEKGFTPEEIDEAAWMGVSFGGSPAMAFYQEIKRSMT
ncbi:MAG: selenide, water dikinase SelD [Planctomycetes bacterium]|nr:selenide, water dikinase SelD [Planctomycetota bacterium]